MQQKLQNLHQVFCAKLGSDRGKAKFIPVKFSKMLNDFFFWDLIFFLDFNFLFFYIFEHEIYILIFLNWVISRSEQVCIFLSEDYIFSVIIN